MLEIKSRALYMLEESFSTERQLQSRGFFLSQQLHHGTRLFLSDCSCEFDLRHQVTWRDAGQCNKVSKMFYLSMSHLAPGTQRAITVWVYVGIEIVADIESSCFASLQKTEALCQGLGFLMGATKTLSKEPHCLVSVESGSVGTWNPAIWARSDVYV